jgi:Rieske 2Fe-2S family protein
MPRLTQTENTIPSHWYFDANHYQRELDAIWYRDWVCVGHESVLNRAGDYLTVEIGTQSIVVTQTDSGLRAFHNTCRHRGSQLCTQSSGRFRNGRIICPYHTWTYSVEGELLATPGRVEGGEFKHEEHSLYRVHVQSWRGFMFVTLADKPATSIPDQIGDETKLVANWPLESLSLVHQESKTVQCNWKVYWENYSECYHCPRAHPDLCRIVPIYKHATFETADVPGWTSDDDGDAETWSVDGRSTLPPFESLSDEDLSRNDTFVSVVGSMYLVAHRDYVRTVRLYPRGPETTELVIDWYLSSDVADMKPEDLQSIIELPRQVVAEDAELCEINQKGLHSIRHKHGTLVAQEFELRDFHGWLRDRLTS